MRWNRFLDIRIQKSTRTRNGVIISKAEEELEKILDDHGVKPLAILPVSAYLEWNEEPTTLEPKEWSRLRIKFDGRYNINKLLDLLENNIDLSASIALMLATRVDQVGRKISEKFTNVFSSVSLAIGASPLPVADFPVLLALQTTLVMVIAYLSGRDMSYDTAKKFLVSLGGLGAVGFGLRALAQQAAKFLNIFPRSRECYKRWYCGRGNLGGRSWCNSVLLRPRP